jgi:uncharacterized protein (DUF885 family)
MNPLLATSIGDDRYNDRLANEISPEYRQQAEALNRRCLDRLLVIDPEQLSGQDRLTWEAFRYSREMELEGLRFPSHLQHQPVLLDYQYLRAARQRYEPASVPDR